MRTVLIGHPRVSWKSWLKENRVQNELICLDPGDPIQALPTKLTFFKGPKPKSWRLYGSLDPNRAPNVLFASLVRLLESAGDNLIIQLPAYRPGPVARQTTLLLAEACRPDSILLAAGTELDGNGFTVGPEEVTLEQAFPPLVALAQRKARWMRFFDVATEQEINLNRVTIENLRLGSGRLLQPAELDRHLPAAAHVETCGQVLLVVIDHALEDDEVHRLLNTFHCTKLHTASPVDYANLVCSFARGSGEEFAFGIIREIDFRRRVARIVTDAVAPAPVSLLRVGSLKVDQNGNELGETKPWSI